MPLLSRRRQGRPTHPDVLTPAEWRVLEGLRTGGTNEEIAARLGVSQNTVKTHISSMLAKLDMEHRYELAAWRGEPGEASRVALRRFAFVSPFVWVRDWLGRPWVAKVAAGGAVVGVSAVCVLALYAGLQNATGSETPAAGPIATESSPTATEPPGPTATPSNTDGQQEFFFDQVTGLRGCDQPLYIRVSGLPPLTSVRVESVAVPSAQVVATTTDLGGIGVDSDAMLPPNCRPSVPYQFRVADAATSRELARGVYTMPPLAGRIDIDPASGGCDEIVVTFRDFPPNAAVNLIAMAPAPLAHNGFSVFASPVVTDGSGFARTEAFQPPWSCDAPALSLMAISGEGPDAQRAELLYRIALDPNEPIPNLDGLPGLTPP